MIRKIVNVLMAVLLLGLANLASAGATRIDLDTVTGVPGTGGNTSIVGPCYCWESAWVSPVMLLQPGTYDFGKLRDYWVQSAATPDAGPDQQNLYVLFAPVVTGGTYPDDFQAPPYDFPSLGLCDQDDAACNASYTTGYQDFDLTYTVAPGQDAVQIELIGNYQYTPPPVPEPVPAGMLFAGITLVAVAAKRRGRQGSGRRVARPLSPHATACRQEPAGRQRHPCGQRRDGLLAGAGPGHRPPQAQFALSRVSFASRRTGRGSCHGEFSCSGMQLRPPAVQFASPTVEFGSRATWLAHGRVALIPLATWPAYLQVQ